MVIHCEILYTDSETAEMVKIEKIPFFEKIKLRAAWIIDFIRRRPLTVFDVCYNHRVGPAPKMQGKSTRVILA